MSSCSIVAHVRRFSDCRHTGGNKSDWLCDGTHIEMTEVVNYSERFDTIQKKQHLFPNLLFNFLTAGYNNLYYLYFTDIC